MISYNFLVGSGVIAYEMPSPCLKQVQIEGASHIVNFDDSARLLDQRRTCARTCCSVTECVSTLESHFWAQGCASSALSPEDQPEPFQEKQGHTNWHCARRATIWISVNTASDTIRFKETDKPPPWSKQDKPIPWSRVFL